MNDVIYLANNTTVGSGTAPAVTAETAVPAAAPAPAAQQSGSMFSNLLNPNTQLILTMVIVFGLMYFLTIRPQRKREKELKEIQSQLKTGDWVVTFSGMYGKVVDIGNDIIMVEFGTNKGVRIPVRRTELTRSSEPVMSAKKEEPEEAEKK